ncbi:MAG: AAA family ATPase [Mariprofundales bacterium]
MDRNRTPQVIAISSGKGGVGKTFTSIHLAARAAQQGKRVLLLDADLGLANVDVMLGISPSGSIQDVVMQGKSLADILVPSGYGFDVLPGGSGFHELTTLSTDQQQVMLDEMRALGRDYDLVVIDTAAGIGDNVLYFVSAAESSLVVLTPDPTSLTDAYALIKVMSKMRDVRRFMVMINQAEAVDAQISFRRLLSVADRYLDVHLDYVGNLPPHPDVRRAIQAQKLLDKVGGDLIVSHLHRTMDAILARPRDSSRSSGLQFFWEHALTEGLDMDDDTTSEPGVAG